MDLKEQTANGGDPSTHWYYISKGRAIKSLIGPEKFKTLLDVGAGSGVFSKMLVESQNCESSVCIDPNYQDAWIDENTTQNIKFVRQIDEIDPSVVLMIDVIEHVDDDVSLMAEYASKVAPGTKFVVSVPAFQKLWTAHDDFLEHRRRYTKKSLNRAVEAAGLVPVSTRYFFGLLFPAVATVRLASQALQLDKHPERSALRPSPADWMNKSLVALHDLERAVLFPFNNLAGVTVFCLAEKPADLAQSAVAA